MTVAPRVRAERCALRESELNREPSFGGWPGYEPWFRQIVVGLSIARCPERLRRSRKRWIELRRETGSLRPRDHGGGRHRTATSLETALLHAFKIVNAHSTGDECSVFLATHCGRAHPRWMISRMLSHILNMSRQRLQTIPAEQDAFRVTLWHTQPPPVGHALVPRALLINIDEMGISLLKCRRTMGHAVLGTRARTRQRSNPGVHLNILAGVSSTGELFFTINAENSDAAVFLKFLEDDVFPRIVGQNRFLMWDNVSFHLGLAITMACHAEGHTPLPCAPYNPDESPIEYFFGEVEKYMRLRSMHITPANFMAEVHSACVNVAATYNLDAVFRHCHL